MEYSNATTTVKLHKTTSKIKIDKGVPFCLNCSVPEQYSIKSLLCATRSINNDGEKLKHLRFAGHIVLFTDNITDTKQMLVEIVQDSFKINTSSDKPVACTKH